MRNHFARLGKKALQTVVLQKGHGHNPHIQEILSPNSQNKGTSGRKDLKDEKVFDPYNPHVTNFKR